MSNVLNLKAKKEKVAPKLDEIQAYIIPGRGVDPDSQDIYNKVYTMWKDTWDSTMTDEWNDKKSKLYSDDFSRQDEILAIFYQGECVGCMFYKYVNLEDSSSRDDSYFKVWKEKDFEQLGREGGSVLVCSNYTLGKNFRRGKSDINWKIILSAMGVKRFHYTDCDAMTGTMRRTKGMHSETYAFSAKLIRENVDFTISGVSEPVDLVGFYRSAINDSSDNVFGVSEIWANTIDLTQVSKEQRVRKAG